MKMAGAALRPEKRDLCEGHAWTEGRTLLLMVNSSLNEEHPCCETHVPEVATASASITARIIEVLAG